MFGLSISTQFCWCEPSKCCKKPQPQPQPQANSTFRVTTVSEIVSSQPLPLEHNPFPQLQLGDRTVLSPSDDHDLTQLRVFVVGENK